MPSLGCLLVAVMSQRQGRSGTQLFLRGTIVEKNPSKWIYSQGKTWLTRKFGQQGRQVLLCAATQEAECSPQMHLSPTPIPFKAHISCDLTYSSCDTFSRLYSASLVLIPLSSGLLQQRGSDIWVLVLHSLPCYKMGPSTSIHSLSLKSPLKEPPFQVGL